MIKTKISRLTVSSSSSSKIRSFSDFGFDSRFLDRAFMNPCHPRNPRLDFYCAKLSPRYCQTIPGSRPEAEDRSIRCACESVSDFLSAAFMRLSRTNCIDSPDSSRSRPSGSLFSGIVGAFLQTSDVSPGRASYGPRKRDHALNPNEWHVATSISTFKRRRAGRDRIESPRNSASGLVIPLDSIIAARRETATQCFQQTVPPLIGLLTAVVGIRTSPLHRPGFVSKRSFQSPNNEEHIDRARPKENGRPEARKFSPRF